MTARSLRAEKWFSDHFLIKNLFFCIKPMENPFSYCPTENSLWDNRKSTPRTPKWGRTTRFFHKFQENTKNPSTHIGKKVIFWLFVGGDPRFWPKKWLFPLFDQNRTPFPHTNKVQIHQIELGHSILWKIIKKVTFLTLFGMILNRFSIENLLLHATCGCAWKWS